MDVGPIERFGQTMRERLTTGGHNRFMLGHDIARRLGNRPPNQRGLPIVLCLGLEQTGQLQEAR